MLIQVFKAVYKATSSQRNRLRRGTLKCSMQDRHNVQLCSGLHSPSTDISGATKSSGHCIAHRNIQLLKMVSETRRVENSV